MAAASRRCPQCKQSVRAIASPDARRLQLCEPETLRVFLELNHSKSDTTIILSDGQRRHGRECHPSTPQSTAVEGYPLHECSR